MAAAGGCGSGGGGGDDGGARTDDGMVLNFDEVVWDRGKGGSPALIGRGANGIVCAGMLYGQPVAIKSEELGDGEEEAWLKAVRLHMRATSPHIVEVRGIIVDYDGNMATHYIVMERLAGSMSMLLLKVGSAHYSADLALRLHLLADVAGGLAYLHASSVIHADIKPDNVLLSATSPPVAKLADFGSSVQRRAGSKTRDTLMGERGSLVYMDPRLFDIDASITTASDVYSFGVMAWQVLSGCVPYAAELAASMPLTAMWHQFAEALRRHVTGGGRPLVAVLVECGVPHDVVALVQACWVLDQEARPAMAEVHRVLTAAAAAAGARGPAAALPATPAAAACLPAAASVPITVSVAASPAARAPLELPPDRVTAAVSSPPAREPEGRVVLRGHDDCVMSLAMAGRLGSGDRRL